MIQNKTKEMRTMNIINKQNGRLCFVFAACIGLFSCTNDADMNNADGNVHFFASVDKPKSRVTESSWDGDELIGVKSGETVKTYKVAVDGTMSTDDTPFRWEGESFDIQAWSPLTSEQINLTDQTTEEKFFDCDLLASSAKVEYKNVTLAFSHKMTRMWWELQKYEGYSTEEVNNAKITFLGYGSTTFTNGELSPIGDTDQSISTYNTWGEYYRNGQAMMVPCEMWEKPLIKVEIGNDTYVYTPSKSNQNDVSKRTGDLLPDTWQRYYLSVSKTGLTVDMESSGIGWDNTEISDVTDTSFKAVIPDEILNLSDYSASGFESESTFITNATDGFSITYTENNASGGIDFEGECDRERSVGDDGKVTFKFTNIRSDIRLAYTTEYMEVGYYLYNDGTYGSGYKENGTAGIIFRVGMHSTDNVSNYDGKLATIHGYAVALNDEKEGDGNTFKWMDGTVSVTGSESPENVTDGNATLYIGYPQTQYLLKQSESAGNSGTMPAAETATAKNQNNSIIGTSGWYLPSHTQLKDLAGLAGKTITGYTVLDGNYWDSSFDNAGTNAYHVIFNNGMDTNATFWQASNTESKVRLILTF